MELSQLYRYSVSWSAEDEVFVAKVTEFPSLAAHGESPEAALAEIEGVVRFVIQDLCASGEPVPEPLSTKKYSGRLNLRMPESLHRALALEAEEENISLNQLITMKLAASLHEMAPQILLLRDSLQGEDASNGGE